MIVHGGALERAHALDLGLTMSSPFPLNRGIRGENQERFVRDSRARTRSKAE